MTVTLRHLTDALSDSCEIERGSIFEPTTLRGVACMVCPPQDVQDTVSLRLLMMDADRALQVGWRVVYGGRRYVLTRLSADPDGLTEVSLNDFNEPV